MELHPLTKPQSSIWNMEQYFGGSIANVTGSALFAEAVNIAAINDAMNKTLEQHDSVRIRIKTQNGTPMQYISAYSPQDFEIMQFSSKAEFEKWIDSLAREPFDLNGDLYRFFIISVADRVGFAMHLHHLTADAWALNLLSKSVSRNLKGEDIAEYRYLDYLAAEQEYNRSARQERDKAYFLSRFESCKDPVYISDRQSKNTASNRLSYCINASDTAKIQAFCADRRVSAYALFMNALAIYIYRIKGAQALYIGTTVHNRPGKREKNTAGMYVNTVPTLLHIDEHKSAFDNLKESSDSLMGIFRHRKYQYSDLLQDIRELHGFTDRLYDVMLNYQNATTADDLSANWHFCGCQGESLTIHINDRNQEGAFHIDYDYQTELFKEPDIQRLHGHLMNIIFDTISNPDKAPQALKMLSDAEYQQVVFDFNDTAAAYPKDKCIHQLFEEQAARTPDKIAIVFEDKKYTYRQINDMANSLAHILREKGVQRNDIVPIIATRSFKIIVAQLAILKAGGAYMPIDPNYPTERIDFMLDDAKCKIALVLGTTIATIDSIDMENDSIFDNNSVIENVNSSEDRCYVIYTSGSTGIPKGAMVSHRNFGNFLNDNGNIYFANKGKSHAFLCIGAFIFDMASAEVYLALLSEHTLVLASNAQLEDPAKIAQLINDYQADLILTVPTRMLAYMNNRAFAEAMSKLKVLSLGGEALTSDTVAVLKSKTNAAILNGYGPAETTMGCTLTTTDSDITIGKPIANTQIYILDKHSNPMPVGAAGELCISGDGVGLGYLNNPELTAQKFVPNPFISGNRMYKSGDLARWRADGNIEYIGRMDNQVKIRGLRIELGEIETAIAASSNVRQVVVTVKKDETGRQFICAYHISDSEIDETAVRAQLTKKLPRYMLPHFFMRLKSFPTTASGKTDRNALPAPDFINIQSDAEYLEPVTSEEKTVISLIQEVLNIQIVGLNDNFFDLGGDSLKAIEFVSKAHYEGFNFSLQDVFDNPTAAALLAHVADGNRRTSEYSAADFAEIHALLTKNRKNDSLISERKALGDVLITGATGWLGAHVLDEFLAAERGTAYCLVRGANLSVSREKLAATLSNYFGEKYTNCTRIVTICGDITENIVSDNPIDTIFHCAANVKHYGSYRHSHNINVGGTQNVIAFAKEKGARLLHISTASVSGNSFDSSLVAPAVFDETKLYIGQSLENVYVRSKFESEAAVLQAKLAGLDAAVIRVGNLSNRRADYRFQRNHSTNATLARLRAFVGLGVFPEQLADFPFEFSPVDDTARAIVKLAQYHNDNHSVFHAYNHKPIRFADFADALRSVGMKMNAVPTEVFIQAVHDAGSVPKTAYIYEAFINDISADGSFLPQSSITLTSELTQWCLNRAGFDWHGIDGEYLTGYIGYFKNIGYWEH